MAMNESYSYSPDSKVKGDIKKVISEILEIEDIILEDTMPLDTAYSLNKFESLLQNFDSNDRRRFETEETKKLYANRRNSEKNRKIQTLLNAMKGRIEFFEYELKLACDIQKKLIPQNTPDIAGFDFFGFYQPSREVSGDYYDYYQTNDGNIFFLISDVSGKGLPSSLTVAGIKGFIYSQVQENKPIEIIMKNLNNYLVDTLIPEKFVTMFLGLVDIRSNLIYYINAGHNPPVLVKRNKKYVPLLDGGTILGMFEDIRFDIGTVEMKRGEIITMYTDGLTETFNNNHEMFTLTRLLDIVRKEMGKPLRFLTDIVLSELSGFCGNSSPQDDITLLLIRKN